MKKVMTILAVICSLTLLGGCMDISQNSEVRGTLEKAFNTAQGNDLFEVGKQVLDAYAPNEESIYIVSSYFSGTSEESISKDVPWIRLVVKYERDKKELKVRLLENTFKENKTIKSIDLLYKGKGQYYTLDNEKFTPLEGVQLYCESKKQEVFSNFKNMSMTKNNGNVYSGLTKATDIQFLNSTLDKINSFFSVSGPKKIDEQEGGITFWNHQKQGIIKQDLQFSFSGKSIEKNMSLDLYIKFNINETYVIN